MTVIREARERIRESGIDLETLVIALEVMDKYLDTIVDGYKPVTTTQKFESSPDTTWAVTRCGKCDGRLLTKSFDTRVWDNYLKDAYIPKLTGNFCPHCGTRANL